MALRRPQGRRGERAIVVYIALVFGLLIVLLAWQQAQLEERVETLERLAQRSESNDGG
jgi:cytochrome oxidase assembly protein ShyY1